MNAKILMFVIFVEAIIYLLLYNLHDCNFKHKILVFFDFLCALLITKHPHKWTITEVRFNKRINHLKSCRHCCKSHNFFDFQDQEVVIKPYFKCTKVSLKIYCCQHNSKVLNLLANLNILFMKMLKSNGPSNCMYCNRSHINIVKSPS